MKKVALILSILVLTLGITAFAAETSTNTNGRGYGSQIMTGVVSKLTGKSVDEINKERLDGKTFYQIATEKVSPEEFKSAVINEKSSIIDERVQSGAITKEQGDLMKERINENVQNCDGQGQKGQGGMGFGRGQGRGQGMMSQGRGFGNCLNQPVQQPAK